MGCQNQSDLLHSHHCDHDYSFTFTFCHLVLWRLWVGVKGQFLKWLGKKTLKISWTVLLLNRNFSMPSMQRCDCSPNNHWNFRTKRNPTTEQNFNQFLFVCLFVSMLTNFLCTSIHCLEYYTAQFLVRTIKVCLYDCKYIVWKLKEVQK